MNANTLRSACVLAVLSSAAAAGAGAQHAVTLTVEELGGIRRTQFPARTSLEIPPGQLTRPDAIRLTDPSGGDVAVQGTSTLSWGDGSVRGLEVDFNVSLGPHERATFRLSYGSSVPSPPEPRRSLAVSPEGSSVRVGALRFNAGGYPLLRSVAYREELVVEGRNGIAIRDHEGGRHDSADVGWEPVEVLKGGPLMVHLRYRGSLTLPGGGTADVQVDAEMPVSKSWVKLTATVDDATRGIGAIAIETPLAPGGHPWTWDFGTRSATYGALRDATGSVVFTQRFYSESDASWVVATGALGDERPYEVSAPGAAEVANAWAHLQGAEEAVAFAIEGVDRSPGVFTVALGGDGQTSFSFEPAERTARHTLAVYQHYVSTPVPIGAATSPASMLSPLRVTVD